MKVSTVRESCRRLAPKRGWPGAWLLLVASTATAPAGEIPRVGERAPDFALESLRGGVVRLADATARGPAVLVVLRGYPGYQCPICTGQVAELARALKPSAEPTARVVLIYPGPAEGLRSKADEFLRGSTLPANFDLVVDPGYAFTTDYGLRWDAPDETAYPSTFVIDREGMVRFAKVSRTHDGRAKGAEILEALRPLR